MYFKGCCKLFVGFFVQSRAAERWQAQVISMGIHGLRSQVVVGNFPASDYFRMSVAELKYAGEAMFKETQIIEPDSGGYKDLLGIVIAMTTSSFCVL